MSNKALTNIYWEKRGRYQAQHDELAACVPESGEADSIPIEMIRVLGRYYYDFYNNGSCNIESFKEWGRWLSEQFGNDERAIQDLIGKMIAGRINEIELEALADIIILESYRQWTEARDQAKYTISAMLKASPGRTVHIGDYRLSWSQALGRWELRLYDPRRRDGKPKAEIVAAHIDELEICRILDRRLTQGEIETQLKEST